LKNALHIFVVSITTNILKTDSRKLQKQCGVLTP
jgi:hypothetical protein